MGSEKADTRRTEFWNLARKLTYANGLPVVVVPLTYNYDKVTASKRNGLEGKKAIDKTDYTVQKKLLIYKDQKGNILADVITVIPTDDNRKKSKNVKGDSFDGYVLAYDNAEKKFMGGWYYKNGKPGNRVRMTGKGGRVTGDCDILVYRNEGPNPPAQVGGGGGLSTPTTGFWDGAGNHWELDYTIPLDCGDGFGNNTPPAGSQGGNEGDVAWFWNATSGGGGGGGGGSNGGGSAPYTPIMIGDDGLIGGSQADNFIYNMNYNHSPSIYFDEDEQAVIREYPSLISGLQSYIDQYGQKPDGSNAIIMSAADQQLYPKLAALIKVLPAFIDQNPKVQQALTQWSGFSISKIKELLKLSTTAGPTLVIYDIQAQYGQGTVGHCTCPGFPVSRLELDKSVVEEYQHTNSSAPEQALASFIAITTLHEFVHYGTAMNGVNERSAGMEFGREFEKQLFGTTMTRANASQFMYKFFKQ